MMRSGSKLSQVGEVEILRNQKPLIPLSSVPEFAIATAAQFFLRNRVNIVAQSSQSCCEACRKVLVELDFHRTCGVAGTGRSSPAEAAANAMAACTSSGLRAGKSARMASSPSPAARLAKTVRRVTRVPRKTGSPPQICGSLTILSSWFIGLHPAANHITVVACDSKSANGRPG